MSSDILVLGAGMVGVGTALALRQRGHSVTLVDRKAPGQETSYGNAGLIQREAVRPYAFPRDWRKLLEVALGRGNDVRYLLSAMPALAPRLARYWGHSAPAAYARLAQGYGRLIEQCQDEHSRWIERAGAQDLVQRHGWVRGFLTQKSFDAASEQDSQVAQAHALGCEVLDSAALARLMPALRSPLAGGIHWTDSWAVSDPGELVARYAGLLQRMGGDIVRAEVKKLQPQGSGWVVQTDAGPLEAAQVVLALGPWADRATRALGYRLPLFVKRGYHRHYGSKATLPMPLLVTEPGVMLAPMARGLRVTTGAEFALHEAPASPVQLVAAERFARTLLDLGEGVEAQPWMGARPCTVDMNPVIGAAPRHPGLWFNFGHGHQGFTLGPASGRLIAELIGGEKPYIDPVPYSPQRF